MSNHKRYCQSLIQYCLCWPVLFLSCIPIAASREANGEDTVNREALSRHLRHEEGLVRTMVCVYEKRVEMTLPEMVELIKDAYTLKRKPKQASDFIYTKEIAQQQSQLVRSWREGDRERTETSPLDNPDKPPDVEAFDGQIVRFLSGEGRKGSIDSIGTSSRFTNVKPRAYGFLYKYYNSIFYSDIIERGRELVISREQLNGKNFTRVLVRAYNNDYTFFEMLFDDRLRLIQRHYKLGTNNNALPAETHEFFDYRRHSNPMGEDIWFPHKVVYHYFAEKHPNGTNMEFTTVNFLIKEIAFNADISDEMFTLRFPHEATIWDGLTNRGLLKPGERPADLFPEEQTLPWVLALSATLSVAILVATVLFFRRKLKGRPLPEVSS